MIRKLMLLASVAGLAACAASSEPQVRAERRPNIVVVVADDLGYGDPGAYGGPIPTPHLDALAASGARMTQGYVTAAVCAPSRAGLLAGRHQNRFGFEFNPAGRDRTQGVPPSERLLPERLKQAGYATGMVGKWHLGMAPGFQPLDQGFDEFYGLLGGATSYFRVKGPGDEHVPSPEDRYINRERLPVQDGRRPVDPEGYLTDVFTDRAVDFVGRNRDRPFFLYLAYTAPHTPLHASAKYAARFQDVKSPHTRVYRAMVSSMDDGIGRLRAKLRQEGLEDDTIIVFLSDNGCANYIRGACSNGSLSGHKAQPWEGGIRVPYLVSWPGTIRPGVDRQVVSALDIASTATAVAGAPGAGLEGRNLVSMLTSRARQPEPRALFWRTGPNYAVREGRWKLMVVNKAATASEGEDVVGQPVEDGVPARVSPLGQWVMLFDLEADPGEKVDLASRHPEVVARLQRRWAEWNRANAEPIMTSRRQFNFEVNGRRVELFN